MPGVALRVMWGGGGQSALSHSTPSQRKTPFLQAPPPHLDVRLQRGGAQQRGHHHPQVGQELWAEGLAQPRARLGVCVCVWLAWFSLAVVGGARQWNGSMIRWSLECNALIGFILFALFRCGRFVG